MPDLFSITPSAHNGTMSAMPPAMYGATELASAPILTLHRGGDGWIPFAAKKDGEYGHLFSIRSDQLNGMFPHIREQITKDAFFGINSMFRSGRGRSAANPDLPNAYRSIDGLRYLNACFADLDGYRSGMTIGQMAGITIDAQNAGTIPPVSIMAMSGRGIWLFWLLVDSVDGNAPPKAFAEKMELYCEIQRVIQERLASLRPDAKAANQTVRIPGSVNTSAITGQRQVRYAIYADANGSGFSYTLENLASLLGVERRKRHLKIQTVVDEEKQNVRRMAWQSLQAGRVRQFEKLLSLRGVFQEGCRNRAALLFAHFNFTNGVRSRGELLDELERFGYDHCDPPITKDEIKGAVKSGMKMKTGPMMITNRRIADWLIITPDESEKLDSWPAASHFVPAGKEAVDANRNEMRDARRRLIAQLVTDRNAAQSLRDMTAILREHGHIASYVTIRTDYLEMGIATAEGGKRKRKREAAENAPSLF